MFTGPTCDRCKVAALPYTRGYRKPCLWLLHMIETSLLSLMLVPSLLLV